MCGKRIMKIIHIFRAPIGGLFRHVVDLVNGQVARGHQVGIVADSQTGNARSNEVLTALLPKLGLGLTRIPMQRQLSPADISSLWRVARKIRQLDADVVHGHGAKGGAFARLAPVPKGTLRVYTPHGGSLHDALAGRFYLMLERILMGRGDLYLFESQYSYDMFRRKIGTPRGIARVVYNGVSSAEFEPVGVAGDATDIIFLGELRALKGVDVLIDAIAILRQRGSSLTATIVGEGPDAAIFQAQVERLGLDDAVQFRAAMPARAALALGKIVVFPSRAESMPYVVLEAAAAGKLLIATSVGGVPEIYGPLAGQLILPDSADALAQAITKIIRDPTAASQISKALCARVATGFTVDAMVEAVLDSYRQAQDILGTTTGSIWDPVQADIEKSTAL